MKEIIADVGELQSRVALLEDGVLQRYDIARKAAEPVTGNIYIGKVENVLSGMQAAFVNIGLERNAFLYAGDIFLPEGGDGEKKGTPSISKLVSPGDEIVVQVLKEVRGSKGVRVTTAVALPGKSLVLMPYANYVGVSKKIENEERERLKSMIERIGKKGHGYIVRTAAQSHGENALQAEIDYLEREWAKIEGRARELSAPALLHRESGLVETVIREWVDESVDCIWINDQKSYESAVSAVRFLMPELEGKVRWFKKSKDIFAYYSLNAKLDKLLQRRVWLESGAYLMIDQTEALTVIDVNTGKFTGKTRLEETILHTNREAAFEIARQIRLRGIGGIIIIDFIDMDCDEDRQKVLDALSEAVKQDRVKTNIVGFTGLGLVEMTRKKTGYTLNEVMRCECPLCRGDGYVLNAESVAQRLKTELCRMLENVDTPFVLIKMRPEFAKKVNLRKCLQGEPALEGVEVYLAEAWLDDKEYILETADREKLARYDGAVLISGLRKEK